VPVKSVLSWTREPGLARRVLRTCYKRQDMDFGAR
jgi:hypothetical protein